MSQTSEGPGAGDAEAIRDSEKHPANSPSPAGPQAAFRLIADIRVGDRRRRDLGDIAGLARSIGELRLLQPICVRPDGTLIDGKRRIEAFRLLGRTHIPVHVVDIDAIVRGEFAANALRKDFTPSELVAIGQELERVEREQAKERKAHDGRPGKLPERQTGDARDKVAAQIGISGRTFEKARAVVEAANAEPERFGELLADMDRSGRVDRAYQRLKIERARAEHASRTEAGCTIDDLVALAASGKRFGVIYADPPWTWETWGGDSGKLHTSCDTHYNTEPLDEIMRLPVAALAADDCALFLWCTGPHVAIGTHVEVIKAWNFRPSTLAFVWVKDTQEGEGLRQGNGYCTRSNAEFVFYATKGSPLRLANDVQQIVMAPRGERHSEKPEEVRRRIERLFPGPYLELYGRKPVPGWTVWGNEIWRGEMNAEAARRPPPKRAVASR